MTGNVRAVVAALTGLAIVLPVRAGTEPRPSGRAMLHEPGEVAQAKASGSGARSSYVALSALAQTQVRQVASSGEVRVRGASSSIDNRQSTIDNHPYGDERAGARSLTVAALWERVVHRFDFDERGRGNIEEVPKFWDLYRPPGFPHYARGGFDFDVGHRAPPSFHLFTAGRNVAYQYTGPDTRILINSEYRIEAWIKPDQLVYGRACLSAHFLDRSGRILIDTIVRSRWIGGEADGDWVRVELYLPAAPVESHSVGLIAWVVQEAVWNPSPSLPRHIPHRDVFGGAWFDDIVIYRLPRAELFTSKPGNVLSSGGEQELRVVLADHDDRSLEGFVSIFAADGGLVEHHDIEVVLRSHAEPTRIDVGHLEPGLYRAQLDVRAQRAHVLSRSLTFARLGDRLGRPEGVARSFGVVLDPASRVDPDIESGLLLAQRVHSLKLPVWTGLPDDPPSPGTQRATDRFHQTLLRNHFAVTAVLYGPPSAVVRSAGGLAPSLMDLLRSPPGVWEPHLAAVAAPYAGTFRWWQIGPDDEPMADHAEDGKLIAVNVRSALRPFITHPQLATTATSLWEPSGAVGAAPSPGGLVSSADGSGAGRVASAAYAGDRRVFDLLTVHVPPAVSTDSLAEMFHGWRRAGVDRVAAYVPPLPGTELRSSGCAIFSDPREVAQAKAWGSGACGLGPSERFERASRLADTAQRWIAARHAGANPLFVPQTWRVRMSPGGRVIEPDETFLILRTLADVLGDAEPGPMVPMGEGVRALSFRNGDSSILAIWATGVGETPAVPHREDAGATTAQLVRHDEAASRRVKPAAQRGMQGPGGDGSVGGSAGASPSLVVAMQKQSRDREGADGALGPTRQVAVQLGRASRQIDLWGRTVPLERDALGRQLVTLSAMPVLIDHVDPVLVDIASSLRVSPNRIESGLETTRLTLDWAYSGSQPVTGKVTLRAPDGWMVTPREFDVRWAPRRIERIPVEVRFNPNETAGRKTIIAQVQLSDTAYVLEIPFQIELDFAEIDVWGLAWLDGEHLIVRHAITNRSSETVHFRSAAGVPGHERQYRPFSDLQPGDTQSTTYRFSDASSLAGRQIRLSLRELNDGHRAHHLELTVP